MSSLARRYRALREIAAYCTASGDANSTLKHALSTIGSVLPHLSLELVLLTSDGVCRRVRSTDSSSTDTTDSVTPDCSVADEVAERMFVSTEPYALTMPDGGSSPGCWVVPLGTSPAVSGALLCAGDEPSAADKDFLEATTQYLSLFVSTKWRPADGADARTYAGKRIEQVSAIYEISQAFDNVPIDDLLKLITEKATLVMDAQACSLMLKNPQKDELIIKASYGLSEQVVDEARVPYGEGVAGRVAQTGQPMLLTNLQQDPRFMDAHVVPRPEIVSSICVPLRDEEGQVQGVLSIRRISPAAMFTEADVELFSVFASQAALAISYAHLYGSLKERIQELSTLYESSRDLSGAYSLEDAANALVRVAVDMADDISAMLVLLDDSHSGRVQASSGVSAKLLKAVDDSIDESAVAWMRRLREPLSFSPAHRKRWPVGMRGLVGAFSDSFAWVNVMPLKAEDSVLGILILGDEKGRLPEQRRVRLLSIVASQAATIIKNASRHEEQIGQQALELSALYQLSERISTAGSLTEALDSILDIVRDIVWYDESFICTADYEHQMMTVQACRGKLSRQLQGKEIAFDGDSLSSWAIRERKALLSADIGKDTRFRSSPTDVRGKSVRSLMAIPLIVHDEVVGVLNVHAYAPNLYTEESVRILSVIASQAAALYKELEALSALANYTDNILRSIAAGVLTLGRDGKVLTWNKAAEDIVGIPAGQAVGRHFAELVDAIGVPHSDRQRISDAIFKVLETGERYLGYKQEFQPMDKGSLFVNMSITQLRDHKDEMLGLVIIAEDVTKEVGLENEMRRISELAAVGQLAASIAHELRNPLSSIKGAAQYLRNEYADHTSVCEFLDIIVEEVNVLSKLTTEFLDFARPVRLNLCETDVNDVLFRTVQFMQLDIYKQKVEVDQNLTYDLPRILADDKQLEQVLRNLILNALQAMPEGGRLVVGSEASEDGVEIMVRDSGVGIPEEQLERIFVPFFTTKTKGTGLGLSIVHKIIDNHGGRVTVESTEAQGTKFRIYLPICSDRARTAMIQAESMAEKPDPDLLRRL